MPYSLTTDSTPSKILHIRSGDADNYVDQELTTGFSITFNEVIRCEDDELMLISLNSAEIPYSFYNIDYKNKYLNIIESQIDNTNIFNIQIVIPESNYNAYEFATILQTLLNNNSQHNIIYTITYDKKTNKFTYLINKNNHKVIFNFSNSDSPYLQMGFNKSSSITLLHNTSLLCDNSIQMFDLHALYIRTNFITNNLNSTTKGYTNILQKIPITTGPNSIIYHLPINSHDNLIDIKTFNNINIRLTDEQNRLIDLQGLHFEISILFKFIKNIKYIPVNRLEEIYNIDENN